MTIFYSNKQVMRNILPSPLTHLVLAYRIYTIYIVYDRTVVYTDCVDKINIYGLRIVTGKLNFFDVCILHPSNLSFTLFITTCRRCISNTS